MQTLVTLLNKALKDGYYRGICGLIADSTVSLDERTKASTLMHKIIVDLGYASGSVEFPIAAPGYCRGSKKLKAVEIYRDHSSDLWASDNSYCKRRRKVAQHMIKELTK